MINEIRLGETDSAFSVNTENVVSLDMQQTTKKIPITDVTSVVDAYEVYMKESSECTKYRLTLTVKPYCTNVLFNTCTEIVANNGGYEDKTPRIVVVRDDNVSPLPGGVNTNNVCGKTHSLKRAYMLDNTEYSSEDIGFDYYPGYDIFGNHLLRNLSFRSVIPTNPGGNNVKYNTISDEMRNIGGDAVKFAPRLYDSTQLKKKHLYDMNNILSMENGESASANLTNQNGWYGFVNNSSITQKRIKNNVVLEKDGSHVINNRGNCDFIDMYPDRTLFSFKPKENPYKRRYEKNWDVFLTYPYKNFYKHNLVTNVYGSDYTEGDMKTNAMLVLEATYQINRNGIRGVQFRTYCKHNLSANDDVLFYYDKTDGGVKYTPSGETYRVLYTGDMKSENNGYYFAIMDTTLLDDIFSDVIETVFYDEVPTAPENYRVLNGEFSEIPQENDGTDPDYKPNVCRYFYKTAETVPVTQWDYTNTVDDFPLDVQNGPQYIRKRVKTGTVYVYEYLHYENGVYVAVDSSFNPGSVVFGDGNTFDDQPYTYVTDYVRIHTFEYYESSHKFYKQKEGQSVEEIVNDYIKTKVSLRFAKISDGVKCEYYFRKFRKLPNFNFTTEKLTEDIAKNGDRFNKYILKNATKNGKMRDFGNESYPLAFSKTIYGDDIMQYQYTDTIDIGLIRDNLNRPLTEFYTTIVKKNVGYKDWYGGAKHYSDYTEGGVTHRVEYSHCFGKVTSGVEMLSTSSDNTECRRKKAALSDVSLITNAPVEIEGNPLELWGNVNMETGQTEGVLEGDEEFFGDLVEYNPITVTETVLSDVFFRFNTAQRENGNDNEYKFTYSEIVGDDYSPGGFKVVERTGDNYKRSLICPEGYYYKAHYRIPVRSFSDNIRQASHYSVMVSSAEPVQMGGIFIKLTTVYPHSFAVGHDVYICDDADNMWYRSSIVAVDSKNSMVINPIMKDVSAKEGKPYVNWIETCEKLNNGSMCVRVVNYDIPDYARNVGTNLFLWRDVIPASESDDGDLASYPFSNKALYIDRCINFYLKRQDPEGLGGLYYSGKFPDVQGKIEVESNYEYIPETDFIC